MIGFIFLNHTFFFIKLIYILCLFCPVANFANSSWGIPCQNLCNPVNTSLTFALSTRSLYGALIKSLIINILSWFNSLPSRSSISAKTFAKNPSLSSSLPLAASNTRFTNPVCTSSWQLIFLPIINASFAFDGPNLWASAILAPPSVTSPKDAKGVSKNAWGAA